MQRPGIDQAIRDTLADLPAVAVAGSCICVDPSGVDPHVYELVPAGAASFEFWRGDYRGKGRQVLAPPAVTGNSVAASARMIYDPIGTGTPAAPVPCIWLVFSESQAPWMNFQRYTIGTNAWAARGILGAMVAALPYDLSLAHVSGMRNYSSGTPMLSDAVIWMNVGPGALPGGGGLGSDIAFYRKTTNAWTVLTGANGARTGAPGAGTSLDFVQLYAGRLVSVRGGGSNLIDSYDVNGDAWADVSPQPRTETWAEGTETATIWKEYVSLFLAHNGRLYEMIGGRMDTLESIDGDDGTAHKGLGLAGYNLGGASFLIIRPHGKQEVQRIQLVR